MGNFLKYQNEQRKKIGPNGLHTPNIGDTIMFEIHDGEKDADLYEELDKSVGTSFYKVINKVFYYNNIDKSAIDIFVSPVY